MAEESAIAVCEACSMPIRVIFKDGEIVKVFAVCGHPDDPASTNQKDRD